MYLWHVYAQYYVSLGSSIYVKLGVNSYKVDYALNKFNESYCGLEFYSVSAG